MLRFAKAHAYGNDFIYIEKDSLLSGSLIPLTREICDRHMGIGADGLIVYTRTSDGAAMSLINADGSGAEVSGNGVRALAALILQDDPRAGAQLTIETAAGPKRLTRTGREGSRQTFRADMGTPLGLRQISLMAGGELLTATVLNMGNPQCVLLGSLPDEERFRRLGSTLEHHSMFPDGTNVEFAHVEAPDRVRIVIWERGCGPTSSSGTGSCAALVAAASFGGAARSADVVAPGGGQRVEWLDDHVYLTGWAELLCWGEWLRELP